MQTEFLLEGLRRLEYRGYDSAGIAIAQSEGLELCKAGGRIQNLADRLDTQPLSGELGIGHTRWATHGPATDENAHPHFGGDQIVAIVHNGVIENYQGLKDKLVAQGQVFSSATDTEVVAHLLAAELDGIDLSSVGSDYEPLVDAIRATLSQLRGTYGLVVLFRDFPDVLIAARLGSPSSLVLVRTNTLWLVMLHRWLAIPTRLSTWRTIRSPSSPKMICA